MKMVYTTSPHLRGKDTTTKLMGDVLIALIPALIAAVIFQGPRALCVVLASVLSACAAEGLFRLFSKQYFSLYDCSAAVTGVLFAMTLPATAPYWIVSLGAVLAVVLVKGLAGGLGQNVFNPALGARAILMLLFPVYLTRFAPVGFQAAIIGGAADFTASATPLHSMVMPEIPSVSLVDLFIGRVGGTIGEVSTLALLIGGIYLVLRHVITVRIPVSYLGTVAVLTLIFHKTDAPAFVWMAYQLLSGGVVLGAIFMATDYVTSPTTAAGQIIYGIGCGALTVFFRYTGIFPEGVTYAILIMNSLVWVLERYTYPRIYGEKKGGLFR